MDYGTSTVDSKLPPAGICLELRNERLSIDRSSLLELPESILLVLFPNGVVLNTQPVNEDGEPLDEEDVYFVDFDKTCLEYILKFYDDARMKFYGTIERQPDTMSPAFAAGNYQQQPPSSPTSAATQSPLFYKQSIIVLREELEYFIIPPKQNNSIPFSDDDGHPTEKLLQLKKICGQYLKEKTSIFTALQRNVNRENNVAEQHLIDMLCMSGFERDDQWGYREIEPHRTCITSLALVLLKTGITHPGPVKPGSSPPINPENPNQIGEVDTTGVTINAAQLAIAQKLLLFWRKPARKCWWDATEVDLNKDLHVPDIPSDYPPMKIWTRRVWTLELSLV